MRNIIFQSLPLVEAVKCDQNFFGGVAKLKRVYSQLWFLASRKEGIWKVARICMRVFCSSKNFEINKYNSALFFRWSENFESICNQFLAPEDPHVSIVKTLPQSKWLKPISAPPCLSFFEL